MKCQEVEAPRPPALKLSAPLAYGKVGLNMRPYKSGNPTAVLTCIWSHIETKLAIYANGADSFRARARV